MALEDHYIGCEEHSILFENYVSYHKYTPHQYLSSIEDVIYPDAAKTIKTFYDFFEELEANKGFVRGGLFKTNDTGLWVTYDKGVKEIESYHAYFAYNYGGMSEDSVNEYFKILSDKPEPERLKQMRTDGLEMATEAISIAPSGEVLKYIMMFRPSSNVLEYFPELEQVDGVQKFIDLNYANIKKGMLSDRDSIRSPIRIQFDLEEVDKISIELVSPFFQKEYYLSKNSNSGYLRRKQLYFERMLESNLMTQKEVDYCQTQSPSWQQFSVKFKWKNGKLVDKKLYNFVVIDFERVE